MAGKALLQSSLAYLSLSSSFFLGQRIALPLGSPAPVRGTDKPTSLLKRWKRKECKANSLLIVHKMHMKVGDTLKVVSGHGKGKVGERTRIFKHNSTVIVKDINLKATHEERRAG